MKCTENSWQPTTKSTRAAFDSAASLRLRDMLKTQASLTELKCNPDWLVPDWPAPSQVHAVCTTRAGGISVSPYDSLNLGDHVGDNPLHVAANRALLEHATSEAQDEAERAGNALGSDLVQALFELRRHPNQEVAFYAVHEALRAMVKLEHPDSAAGGFAAAIVNVLELGIANLPRCDEGAD